MMHDAKIAKLQAENAGLRERIEIAEETLRAIRSGEVDALLVESAAGPQVFTLQGIDAESNRFRGEILAQVSDAVIAISSDNHITYLNTAAERQYGIKARDALGRSLDELYHTRWKHPEDETKAVAALRQHGVWTGENTHITRDGCELLVESSITNMFDPDGTPVGLLAVIRDVTSRKQAEDALHESNERFLVLANSIVQLAWIARPDGHIHWYNQRWYDYTGTTSQQMEGWGWESVHDPSELPKVLELWNRSIATGEPFEMTFPLKGVDGNFRQFLTRATPLRNSAGDVIQWFGTNTDVEVITRAQSTIRESNERITLATEATGVGIWEWNVRTHQIRWDAQMFRIYGMEATEDGVVPFHIWYDFLHTDDRSGLKLQRGARQYSGRSSHEFRIRQRDSGEYRHIQAVEMPRRNPQGIVEWIVGTNLDITERRQTQASEAADRIVFERIATGAKLEDILDTLLRQAESQSNDKMILSILLLDKSGKRLLFGAAPSLPAIYTNAVHGLPVGPSAGSCGTAAFEGVPVFVSDISTDSRWSEYRELAATHGLGSCCSVPVVSLDGKILGTAAAYYRHPHVPSTHDRSLIDRATRLAAIIIERKQAEEALAEYTAELVRADRSKDEFLAMLAHELRNPLAPMRNAAAVLSSTKANASDREQAQSSICRQIENLSRMIDDLLDVSRITEKKIELRKSSVELQSIVAAAVEVARANCESNGQSITVSLPDEPLHLYADQTRLEQILGNILGNACKYSGDGTHISVTAEAAANDHVMIRIADDGIGIDPELLPRIFDLFVQSSRTLDRSHGGLGIGLTIVHHLVKLHGGTIKAKSQGDGSGAEFVIHLPMGHDVSPTSPDEPDSRTEEKPLRILIVDDNQDAAETMAILQRIHGHEVCTAHTGPDAVSLAESFGPNVVLLDIGLPGMDGYEVARRIRQMPSSKHAILIALSGYGSDKDRLLAKSAGFDEHLAKPADLNLLHRWIRERSNK